VLVLIQKVLEEEVLEEVLLTLALEVEEVLVLHLRLVPHRIGCVGNSHTFFRVGGIGQVITTIVVGQSHHLVVGQFLSL